MSQTGTAESGFTLIEIVSVMAILAITALFVFPSPLHQTTRASLQQLAYETASLLEADRLVAIRSHTSIASHIDTRKRIIHAGQGQRQINLPQDIAFSADLSGTCQTDQGTGIVFYANGHSCGGVIFLSKGDVAFEVRIQWLTGGVDVVAKTAS